MGNLLLPWWFTVWTGSCHLHRSMVEGPTLRRPCRCSTYYSFCGNAAKAGGGAAGKGIAGEIRSAVCNSWLKPIDMKEHPTFSAWVIYGVPP